MKHRSEAILIAGFSLLVGWMGAMTGCSTTETASSGAQHASSLGPRTQTITMPLVVLPAVPLKYNGPATYATNPGGMRLSAKKLEAFRDDGLRTAPTKQVPFPELRMDSIPDMLIDKYLQAGDCNAAVVISIAPRILVAAYSEELDCVVLLGFDPKLLEGCHLKVGDRLVAADMYLHEAQADDVVFGSGYRHRWLNFYPFIAEFLSDDGAAIAQAKSRIPEAQWERTWQLVEKYLARFGRVARNGNPYFVSFSAEVPASLSTRWKYHDPRTQASNPGGVSLSDKKLSRFKADLLKGDHLIAIPSPEYRRAESLMMKRPDDMIDEHLRAGDSSPALVISTSPRLLVAVQSDELDCVVLLSFDAKFAEDYHLKEGDRLVSVNTYEWKPLAADIVMGPNNLHRYQNIYPLIAEFLSDDLDGIARARSRISAAEWVQLEKHAKEYVARYGHAARDGSPYFSSSAANVSRH
ncbi:MAG: hypothetical protein JSS11_04745 [Verrucomicrobia bacterium]|nr:hypothetical protein [Verrucomicrobiota bacterium]